MIRSMTGFGEASAQIDGVHYFVEVRSLNNKYFKSIVRLPEEFQSLEAEIESKLRERISRGTVTFSASCSDSSMNAAHTINREALEHYVAQLKAVPLVAAGQVNLDLAALLALPGVLQPPANEEARLQKTRAALLSLLDKACAGLIAMREREGRALLEDLRAQHAFISKRLHDISGFAPGVVAEYEKRLKARIEMMLRDGGVAVEPSDLIRELAVYAERTDIAEEIKRLTGHLEQFADLIGAGDGRALGRTLDFLAQEMLREANTIASKSPDAEISRRTVEIKGAIDRIKEQAANVE